MVGAYGHTPLLELQQAALAEGKEAVRDFPQWERELLPITEAIYGQMESFCYNTWVI